MTSVLERVQRDGAEADLSEPQREGLPCARVVELVTQAAAAEDPTDGRALFEQAGALEGLEELDQVLDAVTPRGLLAGLTGRRRRMRDLARAVLAQSGSAGAVRLASALVGALGDRRDVATLEALAVHSDLVHHAATALAILGMQNQVAVAALLRLMNRVDGAERVIVIDRLLAFVREPGVRLALVRDALIGLAPEHAREVADAIYTSCHVQNALDDPDAGDDVRAGAERIVAHRRPA